MTFSKWTVKLSHTKLKLILSWIQTYSIWGLVKWHFKSLGPFRPGQLVLKQQIKKFYYKKKIELNSLKKWMKKLNKQNQIKNEKMSEKIWQKMSCKNWWKCQKLNWEFKNWFVTINSIFQIVLNLSYEV